MERWLTPSELGKRLALSERTVQRHLRRHAAFLEVRRDRRGAVVSPGSIPVLERIRALYAAGRTGEQVDDALRADSLPVTLDATPTHPEPLPAREALALLVNALEQERTARALAERQAAEDRAALLAALENLQRQAAEDRAARALAERQAAEDRAALLAALGTVRQELAELQAQRPEPALPLPPCPPEPGLSLQGRSLLEKLRRATRGGGAEAAASS